MSLVLVAEDDGTDSYEIIFHADHLSAGNNSFNGYQMREVAQGL